MNPCTVRAYHGIFLLAGEDEQFMDEAPHHPHYGDPLCLRKQIGDTFDVSLGLLGGCDCQKTKWCYVCCTPWPCAIKERHTKERRARNLKVTIHARDISDQQMLNAVLTRNYHDRMRWDSTTLLWDLERDLGVPWKVINAKVDRMIHRGLMDGCTCGCRGDHQLTALGLATLLPTLPKQFVTHARTLGWLP